MRRLAVILIILAAIGGGLWWSSNKEIPGWNAIQQYVENGEILTLEARYTPEQIMESHKGELLGSSKSYGESSLKFHPYLMLSVKYTLPGQKTREGTVLWSLVDGEMVLNTDTWETTHGFEDAINAGATRSDFKILNALAASRGSMTKDQLQKELRLDTDTLEPNLESTRDKHLIIVKGNEVTLHFENPKFLVTPQTKINQPLVTKPYSQAQRVSKQFSKAQIEKITQAAFGPDFTIRSLKEVFLPVYSIQVVNPDGSILTSYWNALTGNRWISHVVH